MPEPVRVDVEAQQLDRRAVTIRKLGGDEPLSSPFCTATTHQVSVRVNVLTHIGNRS